MKKLIAVLTIVTLIAAPTFVQSVSAATCRRRARRSVVTDTEGWRSSIDNPTVGESSGLVRDISRAGDLINRVVAEASALFKKTSIGCRVRRPRGTLWSGIYLGPRSYMLWPSTIGSRTLPRTGPAGAGGLSVQREAAFKGTAGCKNAAPLLPRDRL